MLDQEKSGAVSDEENKSTPELKLSDKLAIERTVLAADRTMLAGVRTSMAFIGFGFTIFNVLRYVQEHSPLKALMRPQTPRNRPMACRETGEKDEGPSKAEEQQDGISRSP